MKAMKKTFLAAAVIAGLGFGAGAHANIIDLFDDPVAAGVHSISASGTGSTAFMEYPGGVTPSSSIIGGYRDLYVEMISQVGSGAVTMDVSSNQMSFSTTSSDKGRGTIQWDGKDGSATLNTVGLRNGGLTGLDLVNQVGCPVSGCTQFVASVLFADLAFEYKIGVYTDGANYSILEANSQLPISSVALATYDFDWFSFASGNYTEDGLNFSITRVGVVDFTNVGALEFIVNSDGATISVDLDLADLTKRGVPEPGALALAGIALLGAGLTGRRRKALKA
jgi:hypothetical protein